MLSSPAPLSTLGKPVLVGGFELHIRRSQSAGLPLFTVTMLLNNDENASADFAVQDGQVHLLCCQAGILMPFGGGERGRDALRAALQQALKVPVSPELAELNAAREACRANRTPATCRRFNVAWCRYHRSIAR